MRHLGKERSDPMRLSSRGLGKILLFASGASRSWGVVRPRNESLLVFGARKNRVVRDPCA
ncbi:MAG: hypothetical protein CL933_00175 [Deltaproteobacteria bacterium]|nr:hypothetical protein [Deltaproteobacteria bacterium]